MFNPEKLSKEIIKTFNSLNEDEQKRILSDCGLSRKKEHLLSNEMQSGGCQNMVFITQIEYTEDGEIINDCRGYFKSFSEAEDVVINNKTDLWETCFEYIVIEEIPEGLYQSPLLVSWYKYNKELNKYERVNQPKFASHLSGFALG